MPAWRAAVAYLVLGAGLVGCTGEPAPTPSAPSVTASAPVDLDARPRESLADGGIVRLRLAALPGQWNPRHPDADADVRRLAEPLSPGAFTLDAAGRATPDPDFVTGVTVGGTEVTLVTLTLHPDAVWGDGTPVTAADWVATWRVMSGQVPGITPADPAGWDAVAEVAVGVDEHEVRLTYRGVEPDWAEPLLAGALPAHAASDANAFDWTSFEPRHHAGAFVVTHVDPPQGIVTLEPNPRWWGDPPRLAHLVYRALADESAPAAFRHNELDLLGVRGSAVVEKVRGAADSSLRTAPGPSGRLVRVDPVGPLADEAVRRALLLALDRGALARTASAEWGARPTTWSDPLLLPTQPGYLDQARTTGLTHDAARAATALDDAGWPVGADGVRARDGEPLALTWAVPAGDDLAAAEFETLRPQLATLGVRLTAVPDGAHLTAVDVAGHPFPLAHLPGGVGDDPVLADLAARLDTETDAVRRADLANQLSRLLWEQGLTITLHQAPQVVAVRTGLANVGAAGFTTTRWEDVGWAP